MNLDRIQEKLEDKIEEIVRRYCQKIIKSPKPDNEHQTSPIPNIRLSRLLKIIENRDKKISKDTTLLASHAFFLLLRNQIDDDSEKVEFLTSHLEDLTNTENNNFQLTICYGFLHLNEAGIFSRENCSLIFEIVYPHCIRYTRYSYFAHKILYHWLLTTSEKSTFWEENDGKIRESLEGIIFSNWDNTIEDLAKYNAMSIFPLYLNIMEKKQSGFVEKIFRKCVDNVCWSNVTKYVILAEICKVLNDSERMKEREFLGHIFESLTDSFLRSAGTSVYKNISKKLDDREWVEFFEEKVVEHVNFWNESKNDEAIHILFKRWIEPTIKQRGLKFIPLATKNLPKIRSHLYQMHIKILLGKHIDVPEKFDLCNDFQKAQFFTVQCLNFQKNPDNEKCFETIVLFFDVNANTDSTYLRNEIFFQFKILFTNILKKPLTEIGNFLSVLYDFFVNCFEIGSTYQRKIFGLNLFRIVLCFMRAKSIDGFRIEESFRKKLEKFQGVEFLNSGENFLAGFGDKEMNLNLLRLVLDSANDVRKIAADLLIQFFDPVIFSSEESELLWEKATNEINSLKFYEIESGATLLKVLCTWSGENFSKRDSWLFESERQLNLVKNDILKACTQNSPFFGIMTVISINVYSDKNNVPNDDYSEKLLGLLEDAVGFFLQVLSTNTQNLECSSSFAEIGIAINETIKNSEIGEEYDDLLLSTAHQNIMNCVWRSLKVCSELAKEVAVATNNFDTKKRCGNLIVNILMKCRLKGAIEAAGVAMGHFCRHLCQNTEHANLAKSYLEKLLKSDEETGANITRRGAGLTIMFHKIVANDARTDRPFLHFAVREILGSLEKWSLWNRCRNSNSNNDDPRTVQLHFLKTLVINKELLSHTTPYLEDIYLVALEYGDSRIFTISGQCTASSLEFGSGSSINHLMTHYPRLARYVEKSLQEIQQDSNHSKISEKYNTAIHILTLLSKLSIGNCEIIDHSANDFIETLRSTISQIFSCPVFHIRALAAKTFAALVSRSEMIQEMRNLAIRAVTSKNPNQVHGILMAFSWIKMKKMVEFGDEHFWGDVSENRVVRFWISRCRNFSEGRRICFVVEKMLVENPEVLQILGCLENLSDEPLTLEEIKSLIIPKSSNYGFHEFIQQLITQITNYLDDEKCIELLPLFLASENPVYGKTFLRSFFQREISQARIEKINEKLTRFANLEREIITTLTECKLFNENLSNLKIPGIVEISQMAKLEDLFFPRGIEVDQSITKHYENLSDLEKMIFARIVLSKRETKISRFYNILLARDDIPQVQQVFREKLKSLDHYNSSSDSFFSFTQSSMHQLLVESQSCPHLVEIAKTILSLVKVQQQNPNFPYDENDISSFRDDVKFLNSFYARLSQIDAMDTKNLRISLRILKTLQKSMNFDTENVELFLGTTCNKYLSLKKEHVLKMLERTIIQK